MLSRVGEADNQGSVCATAMLYDTHVDEICLWAANFTNEGEGKLLHFFAQVGAYKRMFGERFEKESYPCSSSVSQDMYDTHQHACRHSRPVFLEPAVRVPHTQPNCDYLSLFHDGGQNSGVVRGQLQMSFRDYGKERGNPFLPSHG